MIGITGAAGFSGSNLLKMLNDRGHEDIFIVDDFSNPEKEKNLVGKKYRLRIPREEFIVNTNLWAKQTSLLFHIGARTDTAEFDKNIFEKLNTGYSKKVWDICTKYQIPLIYASSAATYGLGGRGYKDDHAIINLLKPLNPYGESKNNFDKWVIKQHLTPPFWAGLKFFNVYGPNEYHKGRMASVIFHAFQQIQKTGGMKLFRSHIPEFKDGEQKRDFIYVKDVVDVLYFLMQEQRVNGIFNLGTGKARTFMDLTRCTFNAMNIKVNISFIDTPEDIRDKYQYFTEANMEKLRSIGYTNDFYTLESGINEYVKEFLLNHLYY